MIAMSERSSLLEERGDPRRRILRALRWFSDGVIAEELFDVLEVPACKHDRDRYSAAMMRLADRGEVERLGCHKPYRYRLPPRGTPRSALIAAAFIARRNERAELEAERDADRRARETRLAGNEPTWTIGETEDLRRLVLRAVGRIPRGPTAIAELVQPDWPEQFDRSTAAMRRLERALYYLRDRGVIVSVPDGYRLPQRSIP